MGGEAVLLYPISKRRKESKQYTWALERESWEMAHYPIQMEGSGEAPISKWWGTKHHQANVLFYELL